jgi:hypothetical protein
MDRRTDFTGLEVCFFGNAYAKLDMARSCNTPAFRLSFF